MNLELLFIDSENLPPELWGYMLGHALGNTIQQLGIIMGAVGFFA